MGGLQQTCSYVVLVPTLGSLVPETVEKYLLWVMSDLVMSLAVGRIKLKFDLVVGFVYTRVERI